MKKCLTCFREWMLILAFTAIALSGCKKDNAPTAAGSDRADTTVTKSPKRGIAFDLKDPNDLAALSQGISWWYNWHYTTAAPANYTATYRMEYIPMIWGGAPTSADLTAAENFILAHTEVKYLLVLNEPNLKDQANRTPQQAAADWLYYEALVADLAARGRTVSLVGPAMNWGTMSGYSDPVVWLDAFYAAYRSANGGADPKIDYLAFHWYDYGLNSQLDRLKKYGKQIWITEMANWNAQINSIEKQAAQMVDMVNICETRTDVFRYAWFYGRGTLLDTKFTYLLGSSSGELTELGRLYISLPFTR